jgi:serine/threonine protein phosphatase PrpC
MERIIRGEDVRDQERFSGKTAFCAYSMAVKKGHGECGDSAFVYADDEKVIAAVFDGVSGEPGAALASSDAAGAMLDYLRKLHEADEEAIKEAFAKAHLAIRLGATTATLLFLRKDGSFIIAAIGDSPLYGINKKGDVSLELPLARAVGDGDSVMKFFYFRNLVTSVLGSPGDLNIHMRRGRLEKGELLILASDGLSDNLEVKVRDGFVTDSSGRDDLKALVGRKKGPASITDGLLAELEKRIPAGKNENKETILMPKEDDIAIIVVKRL